MNRRNLCCINCCTAPLSVGASVATSEEQVGGIYLHRGNFKISLCSDVHTEAVQAALAKHKERKMAVPMPSKRRSLVVQTSMDAYTPPGTRPDDSERKPAPLHAQFNQLCSKLDFGVSLEFVPCPKLRTKLKRREEEVLLNTRWRYVPSQWVNISSGRPRSVKDNVIHQVHELV